MINTDFKGFFAGRVPFVMGMKYLLHMKKYDDILIMLCEINF